MDDVFRLDLADYDKAYILEVLGTFVERAGGYGRRVAEIRMSRAMADRLSIEGNDAGLWFGDAKVSVVAGDFEGTIEVIMTALH